MADDQASLPSTPAPETASEPAPAERSESKSIMSLPLEVFVKGAATTTMRHDRWVAQMNADVKKRQAEADADKRTAKEHGIGSGNLDDIASLYSHEFTDHPEIAKAYVPLAYMSPNGKEVDMYGMGDIIMVQDPQIPDELALIIFCPRCKEKGLPGWDCIITIRQANRFWALDRRTAGELFVDPDGVPQHSAGMVMDGEKFHCPRCTWAASIDRNRVWTR